MEDRLTPGGKLLPGQLLVSANNKFALVMQEDGNLVLYRMGSTNALWASGTSGHAVDWAVLQEDGNFVIYGEGRVLWAAGTSGNTVAWIVMQRDGNLVIYHSSGRVLWDTGTNVQRVPTPPTRLMPPDGATVTVPPSFSWSPGLNNDAIYLNVSTEPSMEPVNVINWIDDGAHYFCAQDVSQFEELQGRTLYWRIAADCEGERIWADTRTFIVGEISVDPHYELLHLAWPVADPAWDPYNIGSINAETLTSHRNQVGSAGASPDCKLGYSFHIPYFDRNDIDHYEKLLRAVLRATEEAEAPVLIGLDGYQWWGGRPDLWNWWDPQKPGYNPDNRLNVEWFGWSSQEAVRDGSTRDWGSPFPMSEPHPNLTSPKVIQANQQALNRLGQIICEWHDRLPLRSQYLFAGVKIGWEIGIGANYNYGRQIGYAAVATAGIRTTGSLTRHDLTRAVQIYLTELTRTIFELGIPRRKIITHVGVHPHSCLAEAALTPFAMPGWSFYGEVEGLGDALNRIQGTGWGNAEWGGEVSNWRDAFRHFQSFKNNKLVTRFGFGKLLPPDIAQGLASVIDRVPSWMHPPRLLCDIQGQTAKLHWSVPAQASEVYLNVSSRNELAVHGGFAAVDVLNQQVTGKNHLDIESLGPGTYYSQIVADGQGRRVTSDVCSFSVSGTE